jgi:hypothetical protein
MKMADHPESCTELTTVGAAVTLEPKSKNHPLHRTRMKAKLDKLAGNLSTILG